MWGTVKLLNFVTLILAICFQGASTVELQNEYQTGWSSSGSSNLYTDRTAPVSHPLDPLNEAEITTTVAVIRRYVGSNFPLKFTTITLKEPKKSLLLPYFLQDTYPPPGTIPRLASVVLIDRITRKTYEITVNLDRKDVETWIRAPAGAIAAITPEEMNESQRIMREDPEVIERCRQLGWSNMSLVDADPWSIGYIGDRPEYQGRRLLQMVVFGKNFPEDNSYAHPFDFRPVVDLNEGRVISIEEVPTHPDFNVANKEGNSVPRKSSNYDPELMDPSFFRQDVRPLRILQPEGASYTVLGNEIRWQKFKLRVGFNGRESTVIHHVSYKDGDEVRPLFYRMSLAEMFVPYGDPRSPFHRMSVFDEGQYGIGYNTFSLEPQVDCIGETHFFDGILHNERGEVVRTPRAVCVTEEDAGILWKHTDFRNGRNSVVRARRLAIMSVTTVGNYDYIFTWYLYQDGTIEYSVKLTGILITSLIANNSSSAGYGTTVLPQVNAPYHQHFFTLRIDPEIDGSRNSVAMQDVVSLPAPTGSLSNPYGQGITTRTTVFRTASEARTNNSPRNSRTWHMMNPKRLNPYSNKPVAYKLMPWSGPSIFMKRDSPVRSLAQWLNYDTWVTPYKDGQMFPGGYYISVTNGTTDGLPNWVEDEPRANVEDTDVVLWHNFGLTHIPRVEDFPIMPIESRSIMLKPVNFFLENPSLDVPPPGGLRQRTEL